MTWRLPALIASCLALGGCSLGDEEDVPPQIGAKSDDDSAAAELGFPFTATKNTTRVGGGDATADAAGVASAVWPATSASTRPSAVVLVERGDWRGGIAASVLAGSPIGAPLLLSDGDELPAVSADTLERLDPKGSDLTKDAELIRIGSEPPAPEGRKSTAIRGKDPYELAGAIDRFWSIARGEPSGEVIVASGERAEYALPAAALAARSGAAVLFARRDGLPPATRAALKRHERPDVFLLGPEPVLSKRVLRQLRPLARRLRRVGAETPVENAIALARFESRGFGWGATVPGHNFTLASTARPLGAVAAASLATNGVFAPLLLTDDADRLPRPLESYLLDVQPGYEDDPGLSVFNHVWLLGDDKVISVEQQARVDEISALIPVALNEP